MSRCPGTEHARSQPGRPLRLRACRGVLLALAVLAAGPHSSAALPPGKSWSAVVDTFKLPGHTFGIWPWRIETDGIGRPLAFVEALGGIGRDMYVLGWQDTSWRSIDHLGYGTKGVRPVPSPEGTYHLIWLGLEEIWDGSRIIGRLVMNEFWGDSLTQPDTVASIYAGSLKYAAAARGIRRWAAVEDYRDLRLFYSEGGTGWIEIPVAGQGDRGVAVAALDDTTALLAWRGLDEGPGAGILRGSEWTLALPPPMNGLNDAAPRMRPRPSGGHWLSWATIEDFVGMASYRDGVWSAPESIFCAYLRPERHYSQSSAAMSRDDGEYPAVSWMAVSSLNGLTCVCVCVPSDTGFTVAENLAGSEGGSVPVVARDRNHDVWVAWQAPSGMGWAHTYTHATGSAPVVASEGSALHISWTLSEPAPGSWWAVLCAEEGAEYEELGRVRASADVELAWTDLAPRGGPVRYRIRRECVDRQYQWLSEATLWTVDVPPGLPGAGSLQLVRASAHPGGGLLRFEVWNARAGPLDLRVYDLRGRQLMRGQGTAAGSGRDSITVDLAAGGSRPAAGLYFLRVADSSGRVSPSAKIVYLR